MRRNSLGAVSYAEMASHKQEACIAAWPSCQGKNQSKNQTKFTIGKICRQELQDPPIHTLGRRQDAAPGQHRGIGEEFWRAEKLATRLRSQSLIRSVGGDPLVRTLGEYSRATLSARPGTEQDSGGDGLRQIGGDMLGRAAEGNTGAKPSPGALRRPGVQQQVIQVALHDADSLPQLRPCRLLEGEQDLGEFRRRQQTEPLLVVGRDNFQGGAEQL